MSEKETAILGTRLLLCIVLLCSAVLLIGATRYSSVKNRAGDDKTCIPVAEKYAFQSGNDQAEYLALAEESPETVIRMNCTTLNEITD